MFWIRPFDGWTRRLRNDCLRSPTLTVDSTFLIEGPYGQVSPLYSYERVILIAGGSGIAGVLPYVQEHLRRRSSSTSDSWWSDNDEDSEEEQLAHPSSSLSAPSTLLLSSSSSPGNEPDVYRSRRRRNTTTRTRDVTLIWTARQREFIEEIFCEHQHHGYGYGHGLSSSLQQGDFHVRLYATSADKDKDKDKEQGEGTLAALSLTPSSPTEQTSLAREFGPRSDGYDSDSCACLDGIIAFGRPDIKSLVSDLVQETALPGASNSNNKHNNDGRIAVLISGPGGMADDARHVVHRLLKEGYKVDYFEEAFGW
jgi:hypothetical protein